MSAPGWVSSGALLHAGAPVAWSNAATYGPTHFSPGGQLSAARVRDAATNTVPRETGTCRVTQTQRYFAFRRCLRLAFERAECAPFFKWCLRRDFFLTCTFRLTRTRFVTVVVRSAIATVPLAEPPRGIFCFQTSLPVSAFIAKTHPRLVA